MAVEGNSAKGMHEQDLWSDLQTQTKRNLSVFDGEFESMTVNGRVLDV